MTRMKTRDSKQGSTSSEQQATEVVVAQNTEVGQVLDFSADAGLGLEGTDKSSFAIPFITLLQGLSPQLETVDGSKPGKFINTITNELYDEVFVVPCAYQRRFLRWAPRSSGGGYKGEYSPIEVETGSLPGLSQIQGAYLMDVPAGAQAFDAKGLPLFDHLSDTRNHFVLAKSATGSWQPALISLSSTQIKKSKRWLSRISGIELRNAAGQAFNPPSFSHIYKLKSAKEENSKGSWWGIEVDLVEPVSDGQLYAKAKDFHASVSSGKVEVAPPQEPSKAAHSDEKF